jgi:hypothetical protein
MEFHGLDGALLGSYPVLADPAGSFRSVAAMFPDVSSPRGYILIASPNAAAAWSGLHRPPWRRSNARTRLPLGAADLFGAPLTGGFAATRLNLVNRGTPMRRSRCVHSAKPAAAGAERQFASGGRPAVLNDVAELEYQRGHPDSRIARHRERGAIFATSRWAISRTRAMLALTMARSGYPLT